MKKKKLQGDLALKIISVLIAIGLWLYIVQVQSPDVERTIKGVPVVFTQKTLLEERNLAILNDNEQTIDVRLRGKRKYLMEANPENITVVADVSAINATGTHMVYTNIILPYANLQILNQEPSALEIEVDHLATIEKEIEVRTQGKPADGFAVGTPTVNPKTVTIKGPKTLIDGVSAVVVEPDVSGKSTDIETILPLKIFGSNNKEIKSSYLTPDIEQAEVRCEILKTKLVSIQPILAGIGPLGSSDWRLDAGSIKQIMVAGPKDKIESIESIKTKPISIFDIRANGEVTAELNLPAGIQSLEGNTFTLRLIGENDG
ncbi:MAG: hypothetical protein IJA08_02105 [Clostridia bacterium]|nr:hypothetical protein [Clostridia bacterium]